MIRANVREKNRAKLRQLLSSFTACLQPAVADFVPEVDQISLRDNFFHSGFNFDMKYFKNAKTVRFVAGWHMVKLS